MENRFQPISVYELPAEIIEVIYERFNSFTLVNAFKSSLGEFKLELIFENGSIHVIYVDRDGHFRESTEGL